MIVSKTPGSLKRFGRTPLRFQQTFRTPLDNLEAFVSSIVSTLTPIEKGCVTIDKVVFEPKHLKALLSEYSLSADFGHDLSLAAAGHDQVAALLRAALAFLLETAPEFSTIISALRAVGGGQLSREFLDPFTVWFFWIQCFLLSS